MIRYLTALVACALLPGAGNATRAKPAETVLGEGHSPMDNYWRSCPWRHEADDKGDLNAMVNCAARATRLADAELNRVYSAKMHRLRSSRQSALRVMERHWLALRDRQAEKCAQQDREPEGAEYPFFVEMCRANATVDQVSVVKRWK